jgi:hypothetical protein
LQWAGYWARHGLATLSIDGVSHGIGINKDEMDLARDVLEMRGAGPLLDALLRDRAWDQDRDGIKDSAADFWTGYLFHTRDVVRQTALDYMQLIRILRTFDGTRRWKIEVEGEGRTVFEGLAGDFDGDGQVDVGKDSVITMAGGSLGGMMSMVMGGVEPEFTAITPMAGGGGVSDLGVRTTQGGALEGFILRAMGPFFTGDLDAGTGVMAVSTIIPDLNDDRKVHIADVTGVSPGDTMIVENLDSGEEACGLVMPDGGVRAAVAADEGDPIAIRFYRGAELVAEVTRFGVAGEFQYHAFQPGEALFSLAEGLALPRAHPDLRRFVGIGQLVLDPADPAVLARHALRDPMTYSGTGDMTGTHVLQITTQGDTSVPVSGGMSFGRAAGLIDYLSDRADLGTTENQYLIDTYVAEGVHVLERHLDGSGRGVHIDVEHLSEGTHPWDPSTYPTSPTPLHIGVGETDALGGISASLFPLTNPTGAHGFDLPGKMVDKARAKCRNECQPDPDACGCDELRAYDVGRYLLDLAGSYLSSGGTRLELDLCHSDQTCPDASPPPEPRDPSELTR